MLHKMVRACRESNLWKRGSKYGYVTEKLWRRLREIDGGVLYRGARRTGIYQCLRFMLLCTHDFLLQGLESSFFHSTLFVHLTTSGDGDCPSVV